MVGQKRIAAPERTPAQRYRSGATIGRLKNTNSQNKSELTADYTVNKKGRLKPNSSDGL